MITRYLFAGKILSRSNSVLKDFLAIKGWVEQTKIKFIDFVKKLENFGNLLDTYKENLKIFLDSETEITIRKNTFFDSR